MSTYAWITEMLTVYARLIKIEEAITSKILFDK
jgi:hypothetical protein